MCMWTFKCILYVQIKAQCVGNGTKCGQGYLIHTRMLHVVLYKEWRLRACTNDEKPDKTSDL